MSRKARTMQAMRWGLYAALGLVGGAYFLYWSQFALGFATAEIAEAISPRLDALAAVPFYAYPMLPVAYMVSALLFARLHRRNRALAWGFAAGCVRTLAAWVLTPASLHWVATSSESGITFYGSVVAASVASWSGAIIGISVAWLAVRCERAAGGRRGPDRAQPAGSSSETIA